jgi:DNA-binding NtrC family response regulator
LRRAGAPVALSDWVDSQKGASVVLIADDDPSITLALKLLFELHDLRAEGANTPASTLERVSRGGVGLVVHDMNFSRADTSGAEGLSLFRALRQRARELPVVLMTSWPSSTMRALVLEEGASAYLAKPWDDAALIALASRLISS